MDYEPLKYISEPEHATLLLPPKKRFGLPGARRVALSALALVVFLFFIYFFCISAPSGYPSDTVYAVMRGDTVSGLAPDFDEARIIRSPLAFKVFMTIFGGGKRLMAGDYYLKEPQGALSLSWRLTHGSYQIQDIRVTIPEGWSSKEIATLFANSGKFVHFDAKEFLKLAAPYEGYLFPDTYFFLPSATAEQVVDAMTDNYRDRIQSLAVEIVAFKRPIADIINMAAIIEEEARTEESRRTIAGILWKRLDQGMPLQVDAAFAMVNGKTASKDLTLDDLKIASPYNTYVNKGLPPGPITNPGLAAIKATIRPISTRYYFYLTDNDGVMRYGITHDDHIANKDRYLR